MWVSRRVEPASTRMPRARSRLLENQQFLRKEMVHLYSTLGCDQRTLCPKLTRSLCRGISSLLQVVTEQSDRIDQRAGILQTQRWASMALLGALAACGDPTRFPDPVQESFSESTGGSIEIGAATFSVAPKAVSGDVEVTVVARAATSTVGEINGLVYDFGPDGLTFEEPAEVALPIDTTRSDEGPTQVAYLDETTNEWIGLPTVIEGSKAIAWVKHFTSLAVVSSLEKECSLSTCGGEIDGNWRLYVEDTNPCEFSEAPAASCVKGLKTRNTIDDAYFRFYGNDMDGVVEFNRKSSFLVPPSCEDSAFGTDAIGTEDCSTPIDEDEKKTACERVTGGCQCTLDYAEEKVYFGGSQARRVNQSFVEYKNDAGVAQIVRYCRKGDILSLWGSKGAHTFALKLVKAGSASDTKGTPAPALPERNYATHVPYMPYGPSASQIIYASNPFDDAAEVDATFTPEGAAAIPLGVVAKVSAKTVLKLTRILNDKLLAKAPSGFRRGRYEFVTKRPVSIYAAYNIGGSDRGYGHASFQQDAFQTSTIVRAECGPSSASYLNVLNLGDKVATATVSFRLLDGVQGETPASFVINNIPSKGMVRSGSFCNGRTFEASLHIQSTQPVVATNEQLLGSDRISFRARKNGHTEKLVPYMPYGSTASQSLFIHNQGTVDAHVKISIQDDKGNEFKDLDITVSPGRSKKITKEAHGFLTNKGFTGGKAAFHFRQPVNPQPILVQSWYTVGGSDRAYVEPVVPSKLSNHVFLPYMPYSPNASQILYGLSSVKTDITVRVFDHKGISYGPFTYILQKGTVTKLARLLQRSLENEGFYRGKIALSLRAPGPIAIHAAYSAGGSGRGYIRSEYGSVPCAKGASCEGGVSCANACQNGGSCVGTNTCACVGGWTGSTCESFACKTACGNGGSCVGPDKCKCTEGWTESTCQTATCTSACQNGGSCTGPNTCSCAEGWSGATCETPTCANECKNGGSCSAPNTCTCVGGWTGPACEGFACSSACQNGGTCVSPEKCNCTGGWTGPTCEGFSCTNTCQNGGSCVGPDTCSCAAGWTGSTCETAMCASACQNGGSCVAPDTCSCAGGWTGSTCETAVCSNTCQNGGSCVSPNTCSCATGWTGSTCETAVCTNTCQNGGSCVSPDTCSCTTGWMGSACETAVCTSTCQNGGSCVSPDTCSCATGWMGSTCETAICTNTCENGGSCVSPDTCACVGGWTGPTCEGFACTNSCQNGGSCTGPDTCSCATGWTGATCETAVCTNTCQNGGSCVAPQTCDCMTGWMGSTCETAVCTNACQNGGSCVAPDTCSCEGGWTGPTCEGFACTSDCENGGSCTGPDTCSCVGGWTGPTCEGFTCAVSCQNGGSCIAPDTCSCVEGWTGPTCEGFTCAMACQNGGTCVAPDSCSCIDGWTGPTCEGFTCASSCENGGSCVGPDTCGCVDGWTGPTCEDFGCTDACQNGGSCVAPDTCSCVDGWTGPTCEGFTCTTDCANGGSCTGPDSCSCVGGWTGSSCEDFSCTTLCQNGGTCTGPDTCSCATGWAGSACETPVCDGTNATDCSCEGAADSLGCPSDGTCAAGQCQTTPYACASTVCATDTDCPVEAYCDTPAGTCALNLDCVTRACHDSGFCDAGSSNACVQPPQCSSNGDCPCGTQCSGIFCAPIPCNTYTDQVTCASGIACQWTGTACEDIPPTPCSSHASQSDCESAAGCQWNDSSCEDASADSCVTHLAEPECTADIQCLWDSLLGMCGPDSGEGGGDCTAHFDQFDCESDITCFWDGFSCSFLP